MLHYNPEHVSSSTLLIFRRTNCITKSSGIVTLCKRPYSMPLSTGILYGCSQRVTIPEAVIIQFVLLKMSKVLLKTWYDMIYLLTAIGLSPGGSSTVHIYTQTIHRTTQNKQYIEQHNNLGECGLCPVLASYTLEFALQLRKKHGKTSVRVAASKNT